ncbi:LCP family protein [Streptomyces sp. NPDC047002]|uniref:LCP family protein n=1 Tax=Streptomyces sp. NPDC047002 TaxID=3155475 RepID=UPI0034567FA4
MGQGGTTRRAGPGAARARELGWDDSLYERAGGGAAPRTAGVPGQQDGGGPPSGAPGGGRGGGPGKRTGRRRFRALRWVSGVLSLLILGTAGAGYLYYRHLDGNLRSDSRAGSDSGVARPQANAAGQTPLNILLIGSDSRASDANVKLGGGKNLRTDPPLADVQMLLHVSADRKNASMVSVPRDTRVDVPACKDAKTGRAYPPTNAVINTTLARGGPGCTLSTWEKLTGVYIDHWMTIDFAGVVQMADAVGGVPVCVRENVWDRPTPAAPGGSGLKLKAGTTDVKGEQALQWLRTRHAFESDLGRSKAQHLYLSSMFRTLKSQNYFTSPSKLTALADAGTKALEVSQEIGSVKKLFDLGMQLKNVPVDRMTMVTMPTVPDPQSPANHLVANTADARQLWSLLRDDVPFDTHGKAVSPSAGASSPASDAPAPADAPGRTAVSVRNGTGGGQAPVSGRAGEVAGLLADQGYARAAADREQMPMDTTSVLYPSAGLEGDARGVAKALGLPSDAVRRSADVSGVVLVVGADWRQGDTYPQHAKPAAGSVPVSADAVHGDDRSACMEVYQPYRW